ncbi:hypothetical protein OJF2_11510 [Aquisphaera giovannonii]|uniref:Uncharacterized protein n=1 Tax=Aquisphaera giovannonii TaxID=406548 RepID=A0A5B9VWQ4_9BACT|nr:hypothetical protein OJF2_11510 [Aquisphaera giovannonii]
MAITRTCSAGDSVRPRPRHGNMAGGLPDLRMLPGR